MRNAAWRNSTLRHAACVESALLTVFPAGLLGWFPSLALLGKPPFDLPGYYPAIIAVALTHARLTFSGKDCITMLKKGSTATSPSDIAVDVRSVVKVFTQSREGLERRAEKARKA